MDQRNQYEITFASRNFDAFATVEVKAFDEAQAVRLAESCMHADFAPQLHHIQAK
jgi:hypothetical protein